MSLEGELATIYETEFDFVWNTLRRFGVREAELPDACHELFLVVHAHLDDYDRARPLRPWLAGIAYRIAMRLRAKAFRRREVSDDASWAVDPSPSAHERLEGEEARALALAAMSKIDLPRRAVFVMSEIDGIDMKTIAQSLDIPLNTAYSRLRLARAEFSDAVRRLNAREGKEQVRPS